MILNHISWQKFLAAVAILLAAYYLVLFLRYYRRRLRTWVFAAKKDGKAAGPLSRPQEPDEPEGESPFGGTAEENVRSAAMWDGEDEITDPLVLEVTTLIKKIKAVIAYAESEQCEQRYLIDTLRNVIRHYPGLKDDWFRRSVKRLIESELKARELPPIPDDEMNQIWIM